MDIGFEGGFKIPKATINKNIHKDWIQKEDDREGADFHTGKGWFCVHCAIDGSVQQIWTRCWHSCIDTADGRQSGLLN